MHKLLQLNITCNWGSTGKIAEEIGQLAILNGWESYIAAARNIRASSSNVIRIGNDWDFRWHGVKSRLFDRQGLYSRKATKKLIESIEKLSPDIIHLHNIHGYYLNYPLLFDYLSTKMNVPIVWTLHDCWPFTGHCAHFDFLNCEKWKEGCKSCPGLKQYPSSLFLDRSENNYNDKKYYFNLPKNITFVPVSHWIDSLFKNSFLKNYSSTVIHNGIDTNVFRPYLYTREAIRNKYNIKSKNIILGVASIWDERKGLKEFIHLNKLIDRTQFTIILVGLSDSQIKSLPEGIIGIKRTENLEELVKLYSGSDVFLNPTLEDNFPTTNIEALACGTPIVTYRTGGSPEAIDSRTGRIVDRHDINGLISAIDDLCNQNNLQEIKANCRQRALDFFDKKDRYQDYLNLYSSLINNH